VRTIFQGGRVFDGTGAAIAEGDVVIEEGRIVDVGPSLDGDEAVDASGLTLLPGLFDCHVHLLYRYEDADELRLLYTPHSLHFYRSVDNLRTTLALGITTVRDAGGADLGMKRAVEEGVVPGPRLQISLTMLSQTGGHADEWVPAGGPAPFLPTYPGMPSPIVDGADEARRKVRELVRAGADVIKIASSGGVLSPTDDPEHPHFRMDELSEIVAEAAAAKRWVMAHAHGTAGVKNAVRAGVRSVDHGTYLDDEAIELMLDRGTWLVPTLVAGEGTEEMLKDGSGISEPVRRKIIEMGHPELESFRKAAEAGVRIAMGTDCPVSPHGTNLRELHLMARNGLTPEQALVAATRSAAELTGLASELGTLEPGKRADVVLVDGDPLEFETLHDRIVAVYKDGVRALDGGAPAA
jgi:imidazolonepropionase-like amidohydrolase